MNGDDGRSNVNPTSVISNHLLQCPLQELLSLLGLQQEALPALVQLIQLVSQVTGFISGRRLQQLGRGVVHRLHGGVVGQDVVSQNLARNGEKRRRRFIFSCDLSLEEEENGGGKN